MSKRLVGRVGAREQQQDPGGVIWTSVYHPACVASVTPHDPPPIMRTAPPSHSTLTRVGIIGITLARHYIQPAQRVVGGTG